MNFGVTNDGDGRMADAQKETLNLAEEQAFQLSRVAIKLDQAREARAGDPGRLADALNENQETWVMLKAIVSRPDSPLGDDVRSNLGKLCQFVADKTFAGGPDISEGTLDALININLQISEGLLEGLNSHK